MSPSPHRLVLSGLLLASLPALADTHFVSVSSTNPVPPYTNWATAANVIQDAVDVATTNDIVLVTNGVYLLSAEIAVTNSILLRSANGAEVTVIDGGGTWRCLSLGTNATVVTEFTITNGYSSAGQGGGIRCSDLTPLVTNCFITGNHGTGTGRQREGGGMFRGTAIGCVFDSNNAFNGGGMYAGAAFRCTFINNSAANGGGMIGGTAISCIFSNNVAVGGGGMEHGTAEDCLFTDNSATSGGGMYVGVANNCVFAGNVAHSDGGGMFAGTANNCIFFGNVAGRNGGGVSNIAANNCTIAGNNAANVGGGAWRSDLIACVAFYNAATNAPNYFVDTFGGNDFSCTTPMPSSGAGNITNAPLFVDTNGWADLRLQSNSPCINAGNNGYVTTTNDLDGNPRIVGGTVDMGAYEQQTPALLPYYNWLQSYGLPTHTSINDQDGDNDNATTWQEWKMWTIPTNGQSVLQMLTPAPDTNGTEVVWQSVDGHSYTLERAASSAVNFMVLQSDIAGQAGTTMFTDTTATNADAFFYRVEVPE